MATVAQLLRFRQVAMATGQTHHQGLGVVEGGGLVVQAVRADGGFNHVELLQLGITSEKGMSQLLQLYWAAALKQEQVRSWTTCGHFRLVSDLLWESAGLNGWELLVIEVCKHTAQDGVMLKQTVQKCLKGSECGASSSRLQKYTNWKTWSQTRTQQQDWTTQCSTWQHLEVDSWCVSLLVCAQMSSWYSICAYSVSQQREGFLHAV